MRNITPDHRPDDFELPGLTRRQLVEFSTDHFRVAQTFLDSIVCARIVSLSVSTIEGTYRVKSTLEGVNAVDLRLVLSQHSGIKCVSIETLFSSTAL